MRIFCVVYLLAILPFRLVASQGVTPEEEPIARKLYTLKCAKCHDFYEPRDYSDKEWKRWMGKMKKKAHLNDGDFDLLLRYTLGLKESSRPSSNVK